jgi:hypothetical protein
VRTDRSKSSIPVVYVTTIRALALAGNQLSQPARPVGAGRSDVASAGVYVARGERDGSPGWFRPVCWQL